MPNVSPSCPDIVRGQVCCLGILTWEATYTGTPDQSRKRTPYPYSADNHISVFIRRGKHSHCYSRDAN